MKKHINHHPVTGGLRIVLDDYGSRPAGYSEAELGDIFYRLTADRSEGRLLCETATLTEMDEHYNPGQEELDEQMVLEAISVANYKRLPRRLLALSKVFQRNLESKGIEIQEALIGRPKKSGLFAYVMVQIPFSDGQIISILFHAPEGDRTKINLTTDVLVAFRWLLNKRDITHIVSPEDGQEVSLNDIGRRLSQLLARNSEKFQRVNRQAKEELAKLKELEDNFAELEKTQDELTNDIGTAEADAEVLEAKIGAARKRLDKLREGNAELEAEIQSLRAIKGAERKGLAGQGGGGAGQSLDNSEIIRDAAGLASGTLASLTGLQAYDEIEKIQGDFVEFITGSGIQYRAWQEAWEEFKAGKGSSATARPEVEAALAALNEILAGRHDHDDALVARLLDEAAGALEKAGLMAEHDALLNQAADHLTGLLKKRAA